MSLRRKSDQTRHKLWRKSRCVESLVAHVHLLVPENEFHNEAWAGR
jgi:hypothetical protein